MACLSFAAGRQSYLAGRAGACSLAVAVLLSLPFGAAAAPPPNDNFADAAELSGLPVEWTGSNVDATVEPGEPDHLNPGGFIPTTGLSIWFRWTAPTDAGVTLVSSGCAPPFQDSVPSGLAMAVYVRSDVFGLVRVSQGGAFRVRAGQVYWIALASSPQVAGASPPVFLPDPDICLRLLPGPSNDDFAQAAPLNGFPVTVTETAPTDPTTLTEGGATSEPGEPYHGGARPQRSVWYSWTAPADGPVRLRLCGFEGGVLAVYTGDRVEALTNVATRRTTSDGCGKQAGASLVVSAIKGEVYRIVIASSGTPPSFQLLVGNQIAVITGEGSTLFSYRAFPGQSDDLELRLVGAGRERSLLVEARGVPAAVGCQAETTPGLLRCPIPGRAAPMLDIDLGDGNDTADLRLLGPVSPSFDGTPPGQVLGGIGNDTLTGSAGSFSWRAGWSGGLLLSGGPGADRLRGDRGFDQLKGGPGADSIAGGAGDDSLVGGPGPDNIDPGPGRDAVDGGSGDDRIRTLDGFGDIINCRAGRDRASIDGIDLPFGCERRSLSGHARAVATGAIVGNDNGESDDYLVIFIACPLDAKKGCRARITAAVPGGRTTIPRRLKLAPGRGDLVTFFRFDEDQLVRRGVRVTVSTQRRGGGTLRFTDRLIVPDERYEGE